MILFFNSRLRSVHQEQELPEEEIINKEGCKETLSLTVWRKSLIISCSGFTVINSHGNLVYRVDNYIDRPQELVLMDGSGKSLHTIRQIKRLGVLVEKWHVYEGEVAEACDTRKMPSWWVKKQMNFLHGNQRNVLAYVYRGSSCDHNRRRYAYIIEGSYTHRSCKVMDDKRRVVAEIKKKEAVNGGVCFGLDVFVLVVQPGIEPGFAMALILILDQMFS